MEYQVFSRPSHCFAVLWLPLHCNSSLPSTDNDSPPWKSYSRQHLHSCPQPSYFSTNCLPISKKILFCFLLSFPTSGLHQKAFQLPFLCFFTRALLDTAPDSDPLKDVESLPRVVMASRSLQILPILIP